MPVKSKVEVSQNFVAFSDELYEFAKMTKLREQWLEANKNRHIKSDSFPFFIYFFLSIIAGLTLINERSHHTVEVVCFSFFFRKFEAQMRPKEAM